MASDLTLEQMNTNIERMCKLTKQDSFTDEELCEISRLIDGYYKVPHTDELDTPKTTNTTNSIVDEDGIHCFSEQGWLRNCAKYEVPVKKIRNKLKKINKYEYYRWLTFLNRHPYPKSELEPHQEYTLKVSCCLCNLTQFKDEFEQTESGGLNAFFFHSHATSKLVSCKCSEKQNKGDTRMLSGGYGSFIADNQFYQYIGSDDKFKEDKKVCDWCINDMIYNGELVYVT